MTTKRKREPLSGSTAFALYCNKQARIQLTIISVIAVFVNNTVHKNTLKIRKYGKKSKEVGTVQKNVVQNSLKKRLFFFIYIKSVILTFAPNQL